MGIENWTGERLETFVNSEVAVEHLHRYAIVLPLVNDKKVLDIASGEGYGSNLIAGHASQAIGVDISPDAIARANTKYKKNNLKFLEGSADAIPLANAFADVVVSFETLEHHDKHEEMLAEVKRVLKPDGFLIMSSPNKKYYTDERKYFNPFHVKELYEDEFKDLIKKHFKNASFYYQRATFASLLIPDSEDGSFKEYKGSYDKITENIDFGHLYIIAVASDNALPTIGPSAFTDDGLMERLSNTSIHKVHSTASYKIGHCILWPFKAIKKHFS